jgi:hypothetical protein
MDESELLHTYITLHHTQTAYSTRGPRCACPWSKHNVYDVWEITNPWHKLKLAIPEMVGNMYRLIDRLLVQWLEVNRRPLGNWHYWLVLQPPPVFLIGETSIMVLLCCPSPPPQSWVPNLCMWYFPCFNWSIQQHPIEMKNLYVLRVDENLLRQKRRLLRVVKVFCCCCVVFLFFLEMHGWMTFPKLLRLSM